MAKTYTAAGSATAGQVYTASAHNVIVTDVNNFIVPPMCSISRTASQSINSGTDTVVAFDTSVIDTDGMGTTGASAKITIQTAGVYVITFAVCFAAYTSTTTRQAFVAKNAGTGTRLIFLNITPTAGAVNFNGSVIASLAASDTLTGYVYHERGSAVNIESSGGHPACIMSATWVGRTS